MSEERNAGFAALQREDIAAAIQHLEAASQADPNDFEAFQYLGGAYLKAQRPLDAINSITRAVQLQPANAQARYNLGIAMESGGYKDQAIQALQQAVALQPDYPKAQEALQRLQGSATGSGPASFSGQASVSPLTNVVSQGPSPQPPSPYGQPAAPPPGYSQPMQSTSTEQPGLAAGYGVPPVYGQQPYGQPAQGQPTYGQPPYSQPPSAASGGPTIPYGQRPMQPTPAQVPDSFNAAQAFKDFVQVILSPRTFFQQQAGREGMAAPMTQIAIYTLFTTLTLVIAYFGGGLDREESFGPFFLPILILASVFFMTLGYLVFAWIVHNVGKMFGNTAPYSGSFRAVVYASAPSSLISLVAALIMLATGGFIHPAITAPSGTIILAQSSGSPYAQSGNPYGNPGNRPPTPTYGTKSSGAPSSFPMNPLSNFNPLTALLNLAGFVWVMALMGMGVMHIQRISPGAAVGVIVLSLVAVVALYIVLVIVLGIAFATVMLAKGPH